MLFRVDLEIGGRPECILPATPKERPNGKQSEVSRSPVVPASVTSLRPGRFFFGSHTASRSVSRILATRVWLLFLFNRERNHVSALALCRTCLLCESFPKRMYLLLSPCAGAADPGGYCTDRPTGMPDVYHGTSGCHTGRAPGPGRCEPLVLSAGHLRPAILTAYLPQTEP